MPVPSNPHQWPASQRDGFTLIEMFVVIVLIGVMSAMAFGKFTKGAAQRATISARDAYVWMGRRGRAAAVQQGKIVRLSFNPSTGQGRLWIGQSGTKLMTDGIVAFKKEFGVTVATSSGDSIVVCYSPRGFALTGGCTTAGLPKTVTFSRGASSATATVQALGQVEANP